MTDDATHLARVVDLATENVRSGGGPFGAAVVRDGRVLATGVNRVTSSNDPTAHAEVAAIREACASESDFSLPGTTVYCSCEPCPMCLAVSLWARVDRIVYAATRHDASDAGFDDSRFRELLTPSSDTEWPVEIVHVPLPHARAPFDEWRAQPDSIPY